METDNYCLCTNPIFEHNYNQDDYLGFCCIECGKGLKPLTRKDKIEFSIFGLVFFSAIIGWFMFLINSIKYN